MKDPDHALYGEFECLPHGHCFHSLECKTNWRGNSFFPTAIWLNSTWSALCASWANMHTVSRLLFECVVGVWLGLGSSSSQWLSVSGWVELILADVCACVCVCVGGGGCWYDMSMHPFIIQVILYLYYRFLCSTTCLCCCKRKCLAFLYMFLN